MSYVNYGSVALSNSHINDKRVKGHKLHSMNVKAAVIYYGVVTSVQFFSFFY